MSQQELWKAGETAASLKTNVHDIDIMLNYMPTRNSLIFKEILYQYSEGNLLGSLMGRLTGGW